jgi:hypothetical protein
LKKLKSSKKSQRKTMTILAQMSPSFFWSFSL